MPRFLYLLSAAGFALFLSGLYSSRRTEPRRRARPVYSGQIFDINHATPDELRSIDGLADYVDRILDERPFTSKIDLLERMVIPELVYNEIKHRITVRHAA
jgi:hypothetical protein